jgi:hypothetical protein
MKKQANKANRQAATVAKVANQAGCVKTYDQEPFQASGRDVR